MTHSCKSQPQTPPSQVDGCHPQQNARFFPTTDRPRVEPIGMEDCGQHDVALFAALPVDLLASVVVTLNGGPIGEKRGLIGFLFPGIVGGRELHYFKISGHAMRFLQCVCKYLRGCDFQSYVHELLLEGNTPDIDTNSWSLSHVPRHFYAGDPGPWMQKLCCGPQTREEYEESLVRLQDDLDAWNAAVETDSEDYSEQQA